MQSTSQPKPAPAAVALPSAAQKPGPCKQVRHHKTITTVRFACELKTLITGFDYSGLSATA